MELDLLKSKITQKVYLHGSKGATEFSKANQVTEQHSRFIELFAGVHKGSTFSDLSCG